MALGVVENPEKITIPSDGRVRKWAKIEAIGNRYLRVILLEDGETVHNAFLADGTTMILSYFEDTDTLYIEFQDKGVVATKDLDENTILDMDADENVISITVEHASKRTDVQQLTVSGIAA